MVEVVKKYPDMLNKVLRQSQATIRELEDALKELDGL